MWVMCTYLHLAGREEADEVGNVLHEVEVVVDAGAAEVDEARVEAGRIEEAHLGQLEGKQLLHAAANVLGTRGRDSVSMGGEGGGGEEGGGRCSSFTSIECHVISSECFISLPSTSAWCPQ